MADLPVNGFYGSSQAAKFSTTPPHKGSTNNMNNEQLLICYQNPSTKNNAIAKYNRLNHNFS